MSTVRTGVSLGEHNPVINVSLIGVEGVNSNESLVVEIAGKGGMTIQNHSQANAAAVLDELVQALQTVQSSEIPIQAIVDVSRKRFRE